VRLDRLLLPNSPGSCKSAYTQTHTSHALSINVSITLMPLCDNNTCVSETKHIRVPKRVYEKATTLQDERDFATIGEAIRHMAQEGGYDV
jgi:hypothetical protein